MELATLVENEHFEKDSARRRIELALLNNAGIAICRFCVGASIVQHAEASGCGSCRPYHQHDHCAIHNAHCCLVCENRHEEPVSLRSDFVDRTGCLACCGGPVERSLRRI